MIVKTFGSCVVGIDAIPITIEVSVEQGISFYLVGLPDSAVKESQQRIATALSCYGFRIPGKKIIINRIAVKNVFANYEMANGTNNIEMLQRNILGKPKPEAKQQKSSSPSAAAKDKKKDAEKTFVITDLTVQDVKVSASVSGVRMTLPLPAIHMTDIGKKKPSTVKEIVSSLIKIFSKETLNAITTATTDALKSGADSIGKMIKNLF